MKNLEKDYYNPSFSHIYVEKEVQNHPRTKQILEKFPQAVLIEIDHYKDVFAGGARILFCSRGRGS